MLNVTLKSKEELERRNYQFLESKNGKKALLVKEEKVLAEINLESGLMQIEVGGEVVKGIAAICIEAIVLPRTILIEIQRPFDPDLWCEIPIKEGQPIFWEK